MGIVKISEIRIDGGTQPREAINAEVVTEYAEDILAGDTFPAVTVFHDGESYWLADGFHRLAAHKAAKREEIDVDVRQGTRREAILHSVGANADHGYRRTNADKRRAVMVMLNDPEWSTWSDREIARKTNTSAPFVAKIRSEVTVNNYSEKSEPRTYTTKHGTTATMNTTNIGKHSKPRTTGGAYVDAAPFTREEYPNIPKGSWECQTCGEVHGPDRLVCNNCYTGGPEEGHTFAYKPATKPLVNLEGIPPEVYTKATQVGGTISRMADATHTSPAIIARGFKEHEKQRVVDNALKSIQWLEQFVQAMGGT